MPDETKKGKSLSIGEKPFEVLSETAEETVVQVKTVNNEEKVIKHSKSTEPWRWKDPFTTKEIPGFKLRYVDKGNRNNMLRKLSQGWVPVEGQTAEILGIDPKHLRLVGDTTDLDTTVQYRELILMKIPIDKHAELKKEIERHTDFRESQAVSEFATSAQQQQYKGVPVAGPVTYDKNGNPSRPGEEGTGLVAREVQIGK